MPPLLVWDFFWGGDEGQEFEEVILTNPHLVSPIFSAKCSLLQGVSSSGELWELSWDEVILYIPKFLPRYKRILYLIVYNIYVV